MEDELPLSLWPLFLWVLLKERIRPTPPEQRLRLSDEYSASQPDGFGAIEALCDWLEQRIRTTPRPHGKSGFILWLGVEENGRLVAEECLSFDLLTTPLSDVRERVLAFYVHRLGQATPEAGDHAELILNVIPQGLFIYGAPLAPGREHP